MFCVLSVRQKLGHAYGRSGAQRAKLFRTLQGFWHILLCDHAITLPLEELACALGEQRQLLDLSSACDPFQLVPRNARATTTERNRAAFPCTSSAPAATIVFASSRATTNCGDDVDKSAVGRSSAARSARMLDVSCVVPDRSCTEDSSRRLPDCSTEGRNTRIWSPQQARSHDPYRKRCSHPW